MLRLFLTLPILLTACLKDETVSGYAADSVVFRLIEVDGQPFAERATISFPEAGKVSGEGPCNRYSASQSVPYPWIEITGLMATKRACPELAQEAAFLDALESMTLVEAAGDMLILSNDAGAQMVFQVAGD